MMNDSSGLRSFKGGAWDLRKTERRRAQHSIAFAERRKESRRSDPSKDQSSTIGALNWVDRSGLDE